MASIDHDNDLTERWRQKAEAANRNALKNNPEREPADDDKKQTETNPRLQRSTQENHQPSASIIGSDSLVASSGQRSEQQNNGKNQQQQQLVGPLPLLHTQDILEQDLILKQAEIDALRVLSGENASLREALFTLQATNRSLVQKLQAQDNARREQLMLCNQQEQQLVALRRHNTYMKKQIQHRDKKMREMTRSHLEREEEHLGKERCIAVLIERLRRENIYVQDTSTLDNIIFLRDSSHDNFSQQNKSGSSICNESSVFNPFHRHYRQPLCNGVDDYKMLVANSANGSKSKTTPRSVSSVKQKLLLAPQSNHDNNHVQETISEVLVSEAALASIKLEVLRGDTVINLLRDKVEVLQGELIRRQESMHAIREENTCLRRCMTKLVADLHRHGGDDYDNLLAAVADDGFDENEDAFGDNLLMTMESDLQEGYLNDFADDSHLPELANNGFDDECRQSPAEKLACFRRRQVHSTLQH